MWVVIGFGIMFISGILMLFFSDGYGDDVQQGFGVLFAIVGALVFLVTSFEYDISSEWIVEDVTHVRTQRMVIVDDGTETWEFESYIDVSSINDSTQFEFEHTTNFWGSEYIEEIRIKKD